MVQSGFICNAPGLGAVYFASGNGPAPKFYSLDKQPFGSLITAIQLAIGLLLLRKGLIDTNLAVSRLTFILIEVFVV